MRDEFIVRPEMHINYVHLLCHRVEKDGVWFIMLGTISGVKDLLAHGCIDSVEVQIEG
jgi:hypothetical protein